MQTLAVPATELQAVVVDTDLGPMAAIESVGGLVGVLTAFDQVTDLHAELDRRYPRAKLRRRSAVGDLLADYAGGRRVTFAEVVLAEEHLRPFRRAVTRACRQVGYGETTSYAGLAAQVGSPKACRAVGTVMATNPWPIIVPCHRVLRSDQTLGGYSARLGLPFKQRLLDLERAW